MCQTIISRVQGPDECAVEKGKEQLADDDWTTIQARPLRYQLSSFGSRSAARASLGSGVRQRGSTWNFFSTYDESSITGIWTSQDLRFKQLPTQDGVPQNSGELVDAPTEALSSDTLLHIPIWCRLHAAVVSSSLSVPPYRSTSVDPMEPTVDTVAARRNLGINTTGSAEEEDITFEEEA